MRAEGLEDGPFLQTMTIQDTGGTAKTVREGTARLKAMLPAANDVRRETVPASHLTLALQCGGSDGYSGITANPALGTCVDLWCGTAAPQCCRRRRKSTAPSIC